MGRSALRLREKSGQPLDGIVDDELDDFLPVAIWTWLMTMDNFFFLTSILPMMLMMNPMDLARMTKSSHRDFPQTAPIDEGSPRQCLRIVDLGFGRERRWRFRERD